MATANVLVLGGPAVGKTHYAGQLLGRLRHNRMGALRLIPGGAEDLGLIEEVLGCLEEGHAAGHTPAETWVGLKWELETRTGDRVVLEWPDYAGERLASIIDTRGLASEWRESVASACAWMFFVRPTTLRLYEDLLSRPTDLAPEQAVSRLYPVKGMGWDDRARYVELLQMLLFAAGRSTYHPIARPRLSVILSCWDELEATEDSTPEEVLRNRLPLLDAFIRSTWSDASWSVWGLSSLGRALRSDSRDEDFVTQGPEKFGYVIPPGRREQESDLTAPVAWLLEV